MVFIELAAMPFDKVVNGEFIHATGYAIVESDGYIRNLYEDDDIWPTESDVIVAESTL